MLVQELNQKLTQVGRGTPMGELLRRYWYPVAVATELDKEPVVPVKLLGEELVLFRSEAGEIGLVSRRCPHRGASLEYGFPDARGLRCPYHGWLFEGTGKCLERPTEIDGVDRTGKVKLDGYPVQALGGLIWAYLGPAPAPLLPRFDLLVREDLEREIGVTPSLPCNWFQMMENSLDPLHLEWLHGHYFNYTRARQGLPPAVAVKRHLKIDFDVFEHGISKRRLLEGEREETADGWRIGHPILFPNILAVGASDGPEFQIRVPLDDTHTKYYWYYARPCAPGATPRKEIPVWENVYREENGRLVVDSVNGQDMMAWVMQGEAPTRDDENLGAGDKGIVLLRRVFREQMEKVARGEDPLGVVRDPAKNLMIAVPREDRAHYTTSGTMMADPVEGQKVISRRREFA